MTTTPKRGGCFGRSEGTVVIAVILTCVVLAGIVAFIVGARPGIIADVIGVKSTGGPSTVINDFLNALIAKDYTKAYGMIHPSKRTNFGGSPQGMQWLFNEKGWELSGFLTLDPIGFGTSGSVVYHVAGTFAGKSRYMQISVRQDGNTWHILGVEDDL